MNSLSFRRPDCESLKRDHEFVVISVNAINPYHVDSLITNIPRDKLFSQKWSDVAYECTICGKDMSIQMPADEAEKERAKIH